MRTSPHPLFFRSYYFLLDPCPVRVYTISIRCRGVHKHRSKCSLVGCCIEVIPLAVDLMPAGVHMASGVVVLGMKVIPVIVPEEPAVFHPAVNVEIVPVGTSVPGEVYPLIVRECSVIVAEPPAVQSPCSCRVAVAALCLDRLVGVVFRTVEIDGEAVGVETVDRIADLQVLVGRKSSVVLSELAAL